MPKYRKMFLCLFGMGGCGCYLVATLITAHDPYHFAVPVAEQYARAQGFDTWGYFGDIVEQPDVFGRATVRIGFTDAGKQPPQQIHVTVRKYLAFGWWRVQGHTTNVWVYEPIGDMPPTPPRPPYPYDR